MSTATDLKNLRNGTCEAATKFFEACRKKTPRAEWIGLAICPDDDVQGAYMMADHRDGLAKRVQRLFKAEGLKELPPGMTEEMLEFLMRIDGIADWPLNNDDAKALNKPLGVIWDNFEKEGKEAGRSALRKKCLTAIVEGLQDFERDVKLNKLVDRDDFLLLVIFPDPDEPKEVRAMAKQLNPPSIYKRFAKAYQMSDE